MIAPTHAMNTGTFRMLDRATLSITGAHAALDRRSVRRYGPEPVSDAQISDLLSLTGRAPSAFNVQPWRFVVVRDASLRQRLSEAAYGQQQIVSAPVVIAVYSDMEDALAHIEEVVNPAMPADKFAETVAMLHRTFGGMTPEVRATWGNAQANIALGYLLLLAKEFGLDTSPMLGFRQDQVKSILDIPESATITALVALGHGSEEGFVSHRHETTRIATFR
jgi:nitroreductase